MRNYQDEQNKNYENTKQMFEACRKDVGDSKKARRNLNEKLNSGFGPNARVNSI